MTGYSPGRQYQHKAAERGSPGAQKRSVSATKGAAPRITALGGGQGLSASLSALRRLTSDLTAVVTVADDGGSSGRLRAELGVLPPATCARRWPRCAVTTTGAAPGPR